MVTYSNPHCERCGREVSNLDYTCYLYCLPCEKELSNERIKKKRKYTVSKKRKTIKHKHQEPSNIVGRIDLDKL